MPLTVGGGGGAVGVTMSKVMLPDTPYDVAVIFAFPSATARTFPDASTVATVGLLDAHVTTTPPGGLASSVTCASSVVESPSARSYGSCALIRTSITPGGFNTSTVRVADAPPTVAVSVAVPAATPVSTTFVPPLPTAVITAGLLDVQVTTQPVAGGGPFAVTLAPRVVVLAVRSRVFNAPEIETALTTDAEPPEDVDTATVAYPISAPDVAVIVVEPADTPVTTPAASTVATAGDADAHVMGQPPAGMVPTVVSTGVSVPVAPGAT